MSQKIPFILLTCLLWLGCKNDTNTGTGQAVPAAESDNQAHSLEDLKSQAISEEDRFARVNHALGTVQKEYQKCDYKVTGQGKMTVFIDEHFTMLIRNEIDKDVIDAKVNLKNLDYENGAISLIADNAPGEFPGLRIQVIDGKPGVEITRNGEFVAEERELKIFMAERAANIEKITPAIVQALSIVHGRI